MSAEIYSPQKKSPLKYHTFKNAFYSVPVIGVIFLAACAGTQPHQCTQAPRLVKHNHHISIRYHSHLHQCHAAVANAAFLPLPPRCCCVFQHTAPASKIALPQAAASTTKLTAAAAALLPLRCPWRCRCCNAAVYAAAALPLLSPPPLPLFLL